MIDQKLLFLLMWYALNSFRYKLQLSENDALTYQNPKPMVPCACSSYGLTIGISYRIPIRIIHICAAYSKSNVNWEMRRKKRFLPLLVMASYMIFPIAKWTESFVTDFAFVGLSVSMDPHMRGQLILLIEAFLAYPAYMTLLLLQVLHVDMKSESLFSSVCFAATSIRTSVLLLLFLWLGWEWVRLGDGLLGLSG